MGHTNQTTNLHLPQFIGSDKPTWLSDVNGAMLAIDTAYGTIEAQASSAATAAAGAVTTANAAQTAADSATSAAATAGTNASQALSTANNAASVALQAQTDAGEALEIVTGKVLASVTADGVKTYGDICNELYAAIDKADLTHGSVLVDSGSGYKRYYNIGNVSDVMIEFGKSKTTATVLEQIEYQLKSTGSGVYVSDTNAGGTTFTDSSSSVVPAGTVHTIYA